MEEIIQRMLDGFDDLEEFLLEMEAVLGSSEFLIIAERMGFVFLEEEEEEELPFD